MPNIAIALKSEIARIARKEAKVATDDFRRASSHYRAYIAELRKRVDTLERELKRAGKRSAKDAGAPQEDAGGVQRRFSPTRLAATRTKLGLSAADFAALIGVSGQSIYKWESGASRPRAQQLAAIASVREIGKREAQRRLADLNVQETRE